MLTLTPKAAAALTAARDEVGAPDTHGVRFFTQQSEPDSKAGVAFNFVGEPEPEDAVTEAHGLMTFVAPEVGQLVGKATVDIEAVGRQSQLVLRPQ